MENTVSGSTTLPAQFPSAVAGFLIQSREIYIIFSGKQKIYGKHVFSTG